MRLGLLKQGMVVEIRNGKKMVVMKSGDYLYLSSVNRCVLLDDYRHNMTHRDFRNFDIVKVYEINGYIRSFSGLLDIEEGYKIYDRGDD